MAALPLAEVKDGEKADEEGQYSAVGLVQDDLLHPRLHPGEELRKRIDRVDLNRQSMEAI